MRNTKKKTEINIREEMEVRKHKARENITLSYTNTRFKRLGRHTSHTNTHSEFSYVFVEARRRQSSLEELWRLCGVRASLMKGQAGVLLLNEDAIVT